MTRKRVIQARVLQELPDGTVGVYYKVIVDSRSFIPDLVVRTSLWHVVQNVWRMAPRCADAKKLCYCVEHKDCLNLSAQRSPCGITESITCGVCDSTLLKSRLEAMARWESKDNLVRTLFDISMLKVPLWLKSTTRAN